MTIALGRSGFCVWAVALATVAAAASSLFLTLPVGAEGWSDKIKHVTEKVKQTKQALIETKQSLIDAKHKVIQDDLNEVFEARQKAKELARAGEYHAARVALEPAVTSRLLHKHDPAIVEGYKELASYYQLEAEAEKKKHPSLVPAVVLESVTYILGALFAVCWAPVLLVFCVDAIGMMFGDSNHATFSDAMVKVISMHPVGNAVLVTGAVFALGAFISYKLYEPLKPIQTLELRAEQLRQEAARI
ncbi:MAG: hypothetical protein U0105_16590 [Candidatus Obscuribacterales bacterium]